MHFDDYLAQRVAELDTRLLEVTRCAAIYKAVYHALHVPQLLLSVSISAASLTDTGLMDETTARRVLASLGIMHLLLQAVMQAVPCATRVAELEQERRSVVCLRNELAVARTHELTDLEKQRLVGRYVTFVDRDRAAAVLTEIAVVSS